MDTEPDRKRQSADSASDPRVEHRNSHDLPRCSDAASTSHEGPSGPIIRSVSAHVSELPCTSVGQWEPIGSTNLPASESGDSSFNKASPERFGNVAHDTLGDNKHEKSPVNYKPMKFTSMATYEVEHNKKLHIEPQIPLEETVGGSKYEKDADSSTNSLVNYTQEKPAATATDGERISTTAQKSACGIKKAIQTCTSLETFALSIVQEAMSSAANQLRKSKPRNARNLGDDGEVSEIEESGDQEVHTNQEVKKTIDENFCAKSTFVNVTYQDKSDHDATMLTEPSECEISHSDVSESHLLPSGVSADALLSPSQRRPPAPTSRGRISPGSVRLSVTPSVELAVTEDNVSSPSANTTTSRSSHHAPLSPRPDVSGCTSTVRHLSSTSRVGYPTLSLHPRVLEDGKIDSSEKRNQKSCDDEDKKEDVSFFQLGTPVENNTKANGTKDVETISANNEEDRIKRLRLAVETLVDEFKLEQELEALLESNQSGVSPDGEGIVMIQDVQSDWKEILPAGAEESQAFYEEVSSILASVKKKRLSSLVQAGGGEDSGETKRSKASGTLTLLSKIVKDSTTLDENANDNANSSLIPRALEEQNLDEDEDLPDSLVYPPVAVRYDAFMETIPLITEDDDSQDDDVVVTTGKTSQAVKTDDHNSKCVRENTSREEANVGFGADFDKGHEDEFKDVKEVKYSSSSMYIQNVDTDAFPSQSKVCESQSMEGNNIDMTPQLSQNDACSKEDFDDTIYAVPLHVSGKITGNHSHESRLKEQLNVIPVDDRTAKMGNRINAVEVETDHESHHIANMGDENNDVPVKTDQVSHQTADIGDGINSVSVETDQESHQTSDMGDGIMGDGIDAVPVETDQESHHTADMGDGINAVPVETDQVSNHTADMGDGINAVPVETDLVSHHTADMGDGNSAVPVETDQVAHQTSDMGDGIMGDGIDAVPVETDQVSHQTSDMGDGIMGDGIDAVPVETDQESHHTADMGDGNSAVPVETDQVAHQTADIGDGINSVSVETDQESHHTADMGDGNSAVPVETDQVSHQTADMGDGINAVPVETDQVYHQTADKGDGFNSVSVETDQVPHQTEDMGDGINAVPVETDQVSHHTADMGDGINAVPVETDQVSHQTADMGDGNNAVPVETDQVSHQTADMGDGNNAVPVETDQESHHTCPQTADMGDGNNTVPVKPEQEFNGTADMEDGNIAVPVEPDQGSHRRRLQTKMPDSAPKSPKLQHRMTPTDDIVPDTQEKLDEEIGGDSSERGSPKPVTASRSHRQLELIQAETCASSAGKMITRSRHSSDPHESHRRSPLAMEDGAPFHEEDVTEGCGSQGQADTTAAVSAGAADSLPLLLDTDRLYADLPQPLDEQISPNMVIKSMSDLREHCFITVRDYRRSYMDREPIIYRGDVVRACKTPNLPYYSLTSVDVLTLVPESSLRPLDLDSGDVDRAYV
ncbi:uncharacterized protein LOC144875292 isoform X2 [Branchiostoma floridae x Branchiostoma japonicum]